MYCPLQRCYPTKCTQLALVAFKVDSCSVSDHIKLGKRMNNASAEEEVKGSWLPLMAVSSLAVIWWLTSSQSQGAVKLRRSFHMQVGNDEFLGKNSHVFSYLKSRCSHFGHSLLCTLLFIIASPIQEENGYARRKHLQQLRSRRWRESAVQTPRMILDV